MKQSKLSINFSKCSPFPGRGRWKDKYWTKRVDLYLKHLNEHKNFYSISKECFCLINCSFLQARDEIMAPHRWSVPKSDIGWFTSCLKSSWSFPPNSGKSDFSLIWRGKFLIRKNTVFWEKGQKYPLLDVLMTLASELRGMGKWHSCCLSIVSIIISYGPILTT